MSSRQVSNLDGSSGTDAERVLNVGFCGQYRLVSGRGHVNGQTGAVGGSV